MTNVPGITDAAVDQIYQRLDTSKLSEWEQKFIASTKDWWTKNRKLSDKQRKRLGELWKKQNEPKRA